MSFEFVAKYNASGVSREEERIFLSGRIGKTAGSIQIIDSIAPIIRLSRLPELAARGVESADTCPSR